MNQELTYQFIDKRIRETGMICRGGFHPEPDDNIPIQGQTCIMIGNAGHQFWTAFEAARFDDNNPLHCWTGSTLTTAAEELGGKVLFPFTGPPFLPFLTWAQRSEAVFPSPIGLLIHPEFGLWHAYRGMLIFKEIIKLPTKNLSIRRPCDTCKDKPCTNTCPVEALGDGELRVDTCISHISGKTGRDCLTGGCLARQACPIGRSYVYQSAQAHFHMAAFHKTYGNL